MPLFKGLRGLKKKKKKKERKWEAKQTIRKKVSWYEGIARDKVRKLLLRLQRNNNIKTTDFKHWMIRENISNILY